MAPAAARIDEPQHTFKDLRAQKQQHTALCGPKYTQEKNIQKETNTWLNLELLILAIKEPTAVLSFALFSFATIKQTQHLFSLLNRFRENIFELPQQN